MIEVRHAQPSDDAALAKLFTEYGTEFKSSLGPQDLAKEGQQARQYYAQGGVLVAHRNGDVVGCVCFEPWTPPRCRMKRMIVAPEHRGKGIGRKLAAAVLITARGAGFTEMCLDTTQPMVAATALYESLGFERFTPDYTAPCNDVFYMRRAL